MTQTPGIRRVSELVPGDKVHMYKTVVEVTAPWHVPEDEKFLPGWGRLPMRWAGVRCAPPELGETLVELADSDQVWNAWFIVQHDLCRNTEDAIAREADGRGEAFAAALCSAVIEHIAELQRRYLHLPEKTERE